MAQNSSVSSGASPTRANDSQGVGAGISPKRWGPTGVSGSIESNAGTVSDPRVRHGGQYQGTSGGKKSLDDVQGGNPSPKGKAYQAS